ncbi:hypothetical protein WJ971_24015 [Achromobacter xylosoxidans]
MPLSLRPSLPAAPAAFRVLAILALAAGLGVWGAILLAPAPAALPAAVSAPAPRAADNTPVALWFGRDEALRTQISVLGVIAAGPDGAAVFSVDGGRRWPGASATRSRPASCSRTSAPTPSPSSKAAAPAAWPRRPRPRPMAASRRRAVSRAPHIAVIFHVHNRTLLTEIPES